MIHVLVTLHFPALVAGACSISQALTIRLRQMKTVIRHCSLFLLSTWLMLLSLSVTLYGRTASIAESRVLTAVGLLYVVASPSTDPPAPRTTG